MATSLACQATCNVCRSAGCITGLWDRICLQEVVGVMSAVQLAIQLVCSFVRCLTAVRCFCSAHQKGTPGRCTWCMQVSMRHVMQHANINNATSHVGKSLTISSVSCCLVSPAPASELSDSDDICCLSTTFVNTPLSHACFGYVCHNVTVCNQCT